MWDTAGQEKFKSLIPSYLVGASIAVIVYDITKAESFANVESWIEVLRDKADPNCLIALVGNKLDLESKRAVPSSQGLEKAQTFQGLFMEVSAKNGDNVQETFKKLTKHLTQDDFGTGYENNYVQDDQMLTKKNQEDFANSQKKKKKCCSS